MTTAPASTLSTAPTGPYRGAGRPEGVFLMERLLDEAARTLGIDPAEIRRRNFVPASAFPYRNVVGFTYDSGDYAAALDRALTLARYDELRKAQGQARERGEIVGVGLASYVENAALGWESGSVRITVEPPPGALVVHDADWADADLDPSALVAVAGPIVAWGGLPT